MVGLTTAYSEEVATTQSESSSDGVVVEIERNNEFLGGPCKLKDDLWLTVRPAGNEYWASLLSTTVDEYGVGGTPGEAIQALWLSLCEYLAELRSIPDLSPALAREKAALERVIALG